MLFDVEVAVDAEEYMVVGDVGVKGE